MQNYYEILNLDKSADIKDIKKAYARLLRQHSPETDPVGFQKIREAYEILSDESSREAYDKYSENINLSNTYVQPQDEDEITLSYLSRQEKYELEITEDSVHSEVLTLSQLSFEQGDYERCIEIINSALDKTNRSNSKNILFYIELLKIYAAIDDLNQFTITLNDFFEVMKLDKSHSALEFIFSELKTMAYDMFMEKEYAYCRSLLTKMTSIGSDSTDLRLRFYPLYRIDNCREHLKEIEEDVLLSQGIKDIIELWLDESMDRSEKAAKLEEVKDQIQNEDKLLLLNSLNRLKKYYNMFYHIDYDYFDKLHQSTRIVSLRSSPKRMLILKIALVALIIDLLVFLIGILFFPG